MRNRLYYIITVLFLSLVAFVTSYGGCGGGGGGSGSSNPPLPSALSVTTQDATDITINSATLNGTVNPNGLNITFCYFRYGLSSFRYENMALFTPYPISGTSPVPVTATLTGLLSGTIYHFKLFAAAGSAGTSYGVDQSFNTLTPISLPAQVTLPNPFDGLSNVSINPSLFWVSASGASSYDVYFGTNVTPPSVLTTTSTTYNPGTLSYSTTYYWQINSRNSVGTTPGIIWSFSTKAPPLPTCTTNPADNITTVSARLNGQVNPNGSDVTSCYCDYGTSTSDGMSATVVSLPGSGTSPIPVTA
ncbi:MAG: hypothetical protein V1709_03520, partial [Planctomycetota bacterium]